MPEEGGRASEGDVDVVVRQSVLPGEEVLHWSVLEPYLMFSETIGL